MGLKKNNPGCQCCTGPCTCGEARDDFAHTTLAVSNGASSIVDLESGQDKQQVCFGGTDPVTLWTFPGISNDSTAILTDSCSTTISSSEVVQNSGGDNVWGGTISSFGSGCIIGEALSGVDNASTSGLVTLGAVVTYACMDGVYEFTLTVSATYEILNPDFDETTQPTWSWTVTSSSYLGTKTIGGIPHVFRMDLISGSGTSGIWQISLSAGVDDPTTTVSLAGAPYDPFGLLVGTATVS